MFYINPPKGKLPLHITEECVFNRLQYLNLLYNKDEEKFNGKFQYLLEDSPYDNVGHFTLRLLVSISSESWSHWLIRERLLLRRRLDNLSPRQLHRLFRNILRRSINYRFDGNTCVKESLITLSSHYLRPDVFKHLISKQHTADCDLFPFKISFHSVPDLVSKRTLDLERGYCIVKCSKWKIVLESLFNRLVQHEYSIRRNDMRCIVETDPRLQLMSQRIVKLILKPKIDVPGQLTAANINEEADKFPPCMRHLHLVLKKNHRLSHYARFYYSLFLKDCGMNLDDSISYWRDEYSKPHTCQSGCTHKWQSSEKKFVYSIRHLYGLEGARVNYVSPNCQTIFNADPGPRYEGGCPFKTLDDDQLKKVFSDFAINDENQRKMMNLKKNSPGAACGLFLKETHEIDGDFLINDPVEYYINVTKKD